MADKQHLTITIDVGLSAKLKERGLNVSSICNTALNNVLMNKEELPLETREEIDAIKECYESNLKECEGLHKDNAILKADNIKFSTYVKEQQQQLQDKDTELTSRQDIIDRQHSEIGQLTSKLWASNKDTERLGREYTIKEQGLLENISEMNTTHKAEIDTLTKRLTEKEAALTNQLTLQAKEVELLRYRLKSISIRFWDIVDNMVEFPTRYYTKGLGSKEITRKIPQSERMIARLNWLTHTQSNKDRDKVADSLCNTFHIPKDDAKIEADIYLLNR